MTLQQRVLDILTDICQTDEVKERLNVDLFAEGLLDSFATVQLLIEIEEKLGISVPISDFDREEWATPQKIVQHLEGVK
ncbi:D-alanine--poly(phosphoribitol) ligase subunit DltC [Numidum massiliense]|uniref:D-alanine--poly(phosphoribitol) ligase subunit DltC n=1 Tax=Numidum massiliense TaxID=1522315 RepID=UPI0006D5448E|nr:D-alanine--poly(phosphoribitol) ligase subunit DltC [Numidum massiliense]